MRISILVALLFFIAGPVFAFDDLAKYNSSGAIRRSTDKAEVGRPYSFLTTETTGDTGEELCQSLSTSNHCFGLVSSCGSTPATPATVNTYACSTDIGGSGITVTVRCAP